MEKYIKDFLKVAKKEKPTYRNMIDFCCDSLILNDCLIDKLGEKEIFFDLYCGSDHYYYNSDGEEITESEFYSQEESGAYDGHAEVYQYYIISSCDAERLAQYTNELVIYNSDLDLYLLCVCHFGTLWDGVPANWKDPESEEE